MRKTARVVVIGGGIAGCSTLYHLTQEGWTDVMLIERDELTSGTTWHSAAQVTNFGMNQTMVGLKTHSINLYKELSEDPGYPINYHHADGGIRLANSEEVMEGYRHFASMAKGMGVDFEVIDVEECARRHPLISTDQLIGGLWDPLDGDIDPAQLCQALARRARKAGAEVVRHNPVIALTQHKDDHWTVHTKNGDIDAMIVVNAGGYRVNEIGAMMGVCHPVISMEHQYFLTEPIDQIINAGHRMPLIRCPISDFYCRQEKQGLLIGFYEQDCRTWGMNGIDPNFANALCPDDPERVIDVLEGAFMRMPTIADTGIHTIINGPITYSYDGAPLVGPIPGKRNAFCIIGLRAGLGEGGGHGWLLAQQIVHGEACYDTWPLDPRRFGDYATVEATALKSIEEYQNEFRFHFPHEHRPAARHARTTSLTSMLEQEGAALAPVDGWERLDYMIPSADFSETHSYRFNETFSQIGEEVKAITDGVGLTEINGFTRFEITGHGVHDWLNQLSCTRINDRPGRVRLAYFLNHHGNVKAEATIATLPDGRVWYGSAAAADRHDMDWLTQHLHADKDISIKRLTDDWCILLLAGKHSRDVLSIVSRDDWSDAAFPWLSVRGTHIGMARAVAMRVSYSGELAFELHIPMTELMSAYLALRKAGAEFGMTLFGMRAVESMRLEKGYLHWKSDLITEFNPLETGLDRFIHDKPDYIGRDAFMAMKQQGPRKKLACLNIDATHAPSHGGASVWYDGCLVGTVTSAGWGYRTGKNLAYAFIAPKYAKSGVNLYVDVLGVSEKAVIVPMGLI
jgi:dimethylglycine dehydrogenase